MASKELLNLRFTDPLTKVYKRRYFDQILEEAAADRARKAVESIDFIHRSNQIHLHLNGCNRVVTAI